MPYEQLEEIQGRRGEKIAMFLTLENAFGLILVAFPAYLVSAGMPFLLRVLIVIMAAALGVAATLDVGGLPFYERTLWSLRGLFRRRISGERVTPMQLSGAAVVVRADRPLPRGGPIRRRSMVVPSVTPVGLVAPSATSAYTPQPTVSDEHLPVQ